MKNQVTNIEEVIRMSSAMGKVFASIQDGKVHKLQPVRNMVIKNGEKGSGIGAIYRLARVLTAANFSKRIVLDRTEDTIKLVSATPAKSAKKSDATKKATKKVTA